MTAVLVVVLIAGLILSAIFDELTGIRYCNLVFFPVAYGALLGLVRLHHPEDLGLDR